MENEIILNDNTQQKSGAIALSRNAALFVEQFLIEADIAASTKNTYRRALRQFFRWYEERGGGDLTRTDILAFKQEQLVKLQASTVGSYLAALKSFFKWLESEKVYPNVAAGVKGAKLSRTHRKDALTPTQVGHVLKGMSGDDLLSKRNLAIFNLLVRTGLRTVEVSRANIEDIRNKGSQTVLWVQGKGRDSKDEFVVLTDAAARPIRAYLAERKPRSISEPLFVSHSNKSRGKRLSIRSLREIVKNALRAADIDDPRLTTHSLRHTAVTLSLLGGASIQQAQALARHSSINTTMLYSHNLDRLSQAPEFLVDDMLRDMS